jgi:hypothetical protein
MVAGAPIANFALQGEFAVAFMLCDLHFNKDFYNFTMPQAAQDQQANGVRGWLPANNRVTNCYVSCKVPLLSGPGYSENSKTKALKALSSSQVV